MSNLSDKELLEMMADFPKHELSTKQRTDMLKRISEAGTVKPRKPFNIQRLGAVAALFILALIAPIFYFTNTAEEKNLGSSSSVITKAQEGDYFALMNEEGKPIYADSNFGIPNKVSLLAPLDWIAKDKGTVAKMMIFLWGKYDYSKSLKVDAVHVKTGVKEHLAETPLSGGIYGTDAHTVTSFEPLPFSGVWNLQFTVGGKQIGEFSIYVKEPYISIGKSTLMISAEDLYAGFYEHEVIEVEGSNLPDEIELEIFQLETAEATTFTFKKAADYTTTDGKHITDYGGGFTIKKSGKYRFTVLQQSQAVEVRKPTDGK
ncbi:hypothetical protein [Neobacillus rhizophilus]|uniref:DUF4871 domain-containing protein n=1 Tax=Neobacillus rhizophilus TaxID=2833579 RepID=A0A942UAB1_9BACI|nr:hypothetical protein [Neobacillus rhizophilus]MBS4215291.1 hypothetical protein [Neobacillus rhizophilus]MBU8919634.1 hypothetical protein [Bacillus sp. FJAT-29953]